MKSSSSNKKDILLDSFEVLKNNYEKNKGTYRNIIGEMCNIDKEIATDMWIWLLKKHFEHAINGEISLFFSEAYDLTEAVTSSISEIVGKENTCKIVLSNEYLKNFLFEKSGSLFCEIGISGYGCAGIIAMQINENNLIIANELFDLILNNKNAKYDLAKLMLKIIDEICGKITEDAFNIMNEWSKQIKDIELRATVNVKLLSFI